MKGKKDEKVELVKITGCILKLKGQEIHLTLDELMALKLEIEKVIPTEKKVEFIPYPKPEPYPVQPYYPPQQPWTIEPWRVPVSPYITWCTTSTDKQLISDNGGTMTGEING